MTDDLVAWLTQVWGEREKAALAVTAAWPAEATKVYDEVYRLALPTHDEQDTDEWDVRIRREEAAFIAANDPASVLARIAADRQILALHEGGVSYPEDCGLCNESLPCATVRLLAQPYADRPGFLASGMSGE